MTYACRILADSVAKDGSGGTTRLTTLEVTLPRIVLAEFNTHRVFSRNSASSRAIPVERNITRVSEDSFVPEAFSANQKGMQAGEILDVLPQRAARLVWSDATENAIVLARELARLGVHKQWANRLLEPFSWHTVIVSATEFENWNALRRNDTASPEIHRAADLMFEAMSESTPLVMMHGDWHLPLLPDLEELKAEYENLDEPEPEHELGRYLARISCARCARVSYLTHDGRRDPQEDIALAARLLSSGHMSPFEHAAKCDLSYKRPEFTGNFRYPWLQYRKMIPGERIFGSGSGGE